MRLAIRFRDRLKGIRRDEPGLLLATRSVHGMWLRHPLWTVALDESLRVVRIVRLRPGRVVTFLDARLVLELAHDRAPPSLGTRLSMEKVCRAS